MLIGVDHGNKQIKTVHCSPFVSGLQQSITKPFGQSLQYRGNYYTLSSERIPFRKDKTEDDRFFVLTLIAIAEELEARQIGKQELYNIQLPVGLPPAHFGAQAKRFSDYFKRDGIVEFVYRDKPYAIRITDVLCYPQAYAAAATMLHTLMDDPKAVVLDIGGFTADYLLLKNGKADLTSCDSLENGVILLYNKIRSRGNAELDLLLDEVCLPLIFIILALTVGRFLWRICIFGAGIKVETDLRGRMFDHLKELSADFYAVNKVDNLMSLFTNDLETIQDCFGSGFLMFCDALFLGALTLVKMARMSKTLTALCMIPLLILLLLSLFTRKYLMKKWELRQQAFSDLSDFSQESFSGIAVIKAFVREAKELLAFGKLNTANERANINYTKFSTLFSVGVTLFVESVICVILGYGGYLVHENFFNAGQLVEFIGYFTAIVWPVMALSQLVEMQSRGKASLCRVSALFEERPTVTDRPDVKEIPEITGEIEYKHLSFSYPDSNRTVLNDISFHIQKGESVGIIGRTGAGKTTLADLLLRTYNVPDGTLFLDGHDVNSLPIKEVRAAIAYVPQDNFLFSDTIGNNIALSKDDSTREEVLRAAKLADIDENVSSFALGYDTVLGERGVTVSGGQKQRISIARALLKEAPILILDDAVSAVDVKTEQKILENLKKERQGKTTLLIAHRVSTVENLDRIVCLEEGRILDVGTHEELYARCPAYKKTVDLQQWDEQKGGEHHA